MTKCKFITCKWHKVANKNLLTIYTKIVCPQYLGKKNQYCETWVYPKKKTKCKHKLLKMGYAEASVYANKQLDKGIRQKQCPKCGLWLWPCEWRKK